MKKAANITSLPDDYRDLDTVALLALLAEKELQLSEKESQLVAKDAQLSATKHHVDKQKTYIHILEEYLRLAAIKRFGASTEKLDFQVDLFDEAELEVALAALDVQLPEEERIAPPTKTTRRRGFSEALNRKRIELLLS